MAGIRLFGERCYCAEEEKKVEKQIQGGKGKAKPQARPRRELGVLGEAFAGARFLCCFELSCSKQHTCRCGPNQRDDQEFSNGMAEIPLNAPVGSGGACLRIIQNL